MSGALTVAAQGRPSIISEELISKVMHHLSKGNYLKPAIEASGISYPTFRAWLARGEEDKAAGRDTLYSSLSDKVARAQADAEAALVAKLEQQQDWRAQAFILERRHRERWGKDVPEQRAAITIQIQPGDAAALVDAMRVARATVIDAEATPAPQLPDLTAESSDSAEPDDS